MRISLFLSLSLAFTLALKATCTSPPEDLEASGDDPGDSGSGSGEWFLSGEVSKSGGSERRAQAGEGSVWSLKDFGSQSQYVVVSNSQKSLWENEQIIAGVAAGGVVGLVLAAILAGLLIYTWHKKEAGGYIQGQPTRSEDTV